MRQKNFRSWEIQSLLHAGRKQLKLVSLLSSLLTLLQEAEAQGKQLNQVEETFRIFLIEYIKLWIFVETIARKIVQSLLLKVSKSIAC